ncbi:MAG TPA: transketolase C-terminal domain-containing protein, partial [Leptospiraceae bacterium]|nr:transketolase C-terminal domain-containing protein [Leptospiraceae bacterium]
YEYKGPVYVRVGRPNIPILARPADYHFEIGKAELRRRGNKAVIIACGVMVTEADTAAEILAAKGIEVSVINMATIKPIDEKAILEEAKRTGLVITCEEHNIKGGLGSAVSEYLSEVHPTKVIRMGMKDEFGKSGTWQALMDYFGLRAKNIAETVEKHLS